MRDVTLRLYFSIRYRIKNTCINYQSLRRNVISYRLIVFRLKNKIINALLYNTENYFGYMLTSLFRQAICVG